LFATLDPAVRKARLPGGMPFTLTDTVGFVRHLPHQLVDAFRSTLEEVADADLIVHVVDGSDADPRSQIAAVREVLAEIGARDVPELVVFNKADAADDIEMKGLQLAERQSVVVSARTGRGVPELLAEIERLLPRRDAEVTAVVPYARGDLLARAHRDGEVLQVEHTDSGTALTARVPLGLAAELDEFAVTAR
jgi:GTP-binding protein HflX